MVKNPELEMKNLKNKKFFIKNILRNNIHLPQSFYILLKIKIIFKKIFIDNLKYHML